MIKLLLIPLVLFMASIHTACTSVPTVNPESVVPPTPTPTESPLHMIPLEIRGVTLGASPDEAINKLGKPARSRKRVKDNCGEETVLEFQYKGLKIEFGWYDVENRYFAQLFEVTGSKWPIGGNIFVGSSIDDVTRSFGEPWDFDESKQTVTYGYTVGPDNNVGELEFVNGRLKGAVWFINPC